MVINGANLNNFTASQTARSVLGVQKQDGSSGTPLGNVLGNNFEKRFDRLKISDLFKQLANGASSEEFAAGNIAASGRAAEMRKMLSKTETAESADKISKGMAGYAYMEIAIAGEAARTKANQYLYSRYSEERDYYQGLLDDPDGITHSAADEYGTVTGLYRDDYEYICAEGTAFDREKAEQALADIQSKIDDLINEDHSDRVDFKTYNNCAKAAAGAFGIDSSEFPLDEDGFNKLFGKAEVASEEDFVKTCSEREKGLTALCRKLHECRDNFMKDVRSSENGKDRANAIEKAFTSAYGKSFIDIAKLIEEMKTDKDEGENK
ncbi:MAG: hypothetical protein K2N72_06345 [Oscillospiraceae bacterium]|nr:hypothetical protein [Oscillospiraceae bacterium]